MRNEERGIRNSEVPVAASAFYFLILSSSFFIPHCIIGLRAKLALSAALEPSFSKRRFPICLTSAGALPRIHMRPQLANSRADEFMPSDVSASDTIDETARRHFELAWRDKNPRAIEDFLPAADSPHFLATLEELVQIDLEMRWKTEPGAPPRLESYLKRFPQLDQPERVRRLLHQEYRIRSQQGESPDVTEYQQRFPDIVRSDEDLQVTVASKTRPVETLSGLEGYDIVEVLGKGGMGVVYKARQKRLNRLVAIKTVLAGAQSEDLLRFMNEAEAVARLQHPHIVQIYEVNMQEGRPYFSSMEVVEGGNLAELLKGGVLVPPRDAARLVEQVTRAVEYAHAARASFIAISSRHNILLASSGQPAAGSNEREPPAAGCLLSAVPKISDFGLAKYMDLGMYSTQTGAIAGTPSYMAGAGVGEIGDHRPLHGYSLRQAPFYMSC